MCVCLAAQWLRKRRQDIVLRPKRLPVTLFPLIFNLVLDFFMFLFAILALLSSPLNPLIDKRREKEEEEECASFH